jgi:hypothetical protein
MKKFFRRQIAEPFEAAFGLVCIWNGIAAMLGWGMPADVFRATLGNELANTFSIIYFFAGLGLYFGIGLNRINIEAVGLIMVSMSLLIRCMVLLSVDTNPPVLILSGDASVKELETFLGINTALLSTYVTSIFFIVYSGVRLWSLTKYQIVLQPKSPFLQNALDND